MLGLPSISDYISAVMLVSPPLESLCVRNFGDPKRECRCSPKQVENYRNRISGPLLDRIDIHVEAPAVEYKELSSDERAESSESIRERVLQARRIQHERFAAKPKCRANAEMTHGLLRGPIASWTTRDANSSITRWKNSI